MCIAAARDCFLLAALHSVAERVNPRKARPPASHGPRVLASAAGPHLPLLGEESRASRGSARTRTPSLAILSTPGDIPRWLDQAGTKLRIVAAEACGAVFGQTGTHHVGWYACPRLTLFATEWSAARRKPLRAAAMHLSAAISADVKARRLPTSGRRKFPSAEIFEARATLREQRESAVGRRIRQPRRPRLPEDRPARLRHRNPGSPSPFARNRGMSPFTHNQLSTDLSADPGRAASAPSAASSPAPRRRT